MIACVRRAERRAQPGAALDRGLVVSRIRGDRSAHGKSTDQTARDLVAAQSRGRHANQASRASKTARQSNPGGAQFPGSRNDSREEVSLVATPEDLGRESWIQDGLRILRDLESHHGSHRVLFLLSFGREATAYDMRKRLGIGQTALEGSVATLCRQGLIELGHPMPFPRTRARAYRLSRRGSILAVRLNEALGLLAHKDGRL